MQVRRGDDGFMLRVFALATLCLAITRSGAPQELRVLHIKVVLIDAEHRRKIHRSRADPGHPGIVLSDHDRQTSL